MKHASLAFDWDSGNRDKCQKHGASIAEIEELFAGEPRVAPDLKHSDEEQRFIAVGRTGAGRPLFVAFTIRQIAAQACIRPVSARPMHQREIQHYEQGKG